jgi:Tfp pilus assembly protein PilX
MGSINQTRLSSEKGFALVTAIMACAILFALAMLILQLSTGDQRVSSRSVGDKKASIAAETGVQRVLTGFDPESPPSAANVQVDSANDASSVYSFAAPAPPSKESGIPAFAPLTGYSIGGGQSWGQTRYGTTITGRNTSYSTSVQLDVGIGYGPVEISTMSR